MFFLEKKNQKTFIRSHPEARARGTKVFLLLFLQKKKILASSPALPPFRPDF
jgi:hypothetical protein